MDLLTYLRLHEPGELVHVSGSEYCTREHDSLKISNGKWMWFSRGFGGATALDYLVKVKQIPFTQAMGMVLDAEVSKPSFFYAQRQARSGIRKQKRLLLPDRSETNDRIISYLAGRGIDRKIIEACIQEGLMYESLPYHNCIFVGYDEGGTARYASFRATIPEKIMGDAAGSDKDDLEAWKASDRYIRKNIPDHEYNGDALKSELYSLKLQLDGLYDKIRPQNEELELLKDVRSYVKRLLPELEPDGEALTPERRQEKIEAIQQRLAKAKAEAETNAAAYAKSKETAARDDREER